MARCSRRRQIRRCRAPGQRRRPPDPVHPVPATMKPTGSRGGGGGAPRIYWRDNPDPRAPHCTSLRRRPPRALAHPPPTTVPHPPRWCMCERERDEREIPCAKKMHHAERDAEVHVGVRWSQSSWQGRRRLQRKAAASDKEERRGRKRK